MQHTDFVPSACDPERKKGDSGMFRFKTRFFLFALVLLFTLLTFPYITTAHQSNLCPVHEHTVHEIGGCTDIWHGEMKYDPHTGCWTSESCTLGFLWTVTTCPDGVQDPLRRCLWRNPLMSVMDIWLLIPGGCSGNNKPHTWFTCSFDSCPYEATSS